MRKIVVLLCLIFIQPACYAQSQPYSIRNYTAMDGLPQSQVGIMLEDKNGYLWIGTEGGGLARFDGREFKVYTTLDGLASNIVTFLKLDTDQNLWIVHPRGLTKFDGVNFKKFIQPGNPSNTRRFRRLFEVNDTLFVVSAPGSVGKIYQDSVHYWSKPVRKNVLLNYTHLKPNKEILLYLSDSSFLVRTRTGDYSLEHQRHFFRLYSVFNYHDDVWLKTENGFFTIDFRNRTFVPREFPIQHVVLFHDSLNNVFWTRDGNKLMRERLKEDGSSESEVVLDDVTINQILVDSEGNTWLASDGSGLFKYFIQDFDRCGSDHMAGVMAIHRDSGGATWIGTMTRGIWRIHKGKIKHFVDPKELRRNAVVTIRESPNGEIWVGSGFGLGIYQEGTDNFRWFTRDDGLSNATIVGITFDDQSGVWSATLGGGVNYYDGKKFTAYTVNNGLTTNVVNAICFSTYYKKVFVGSEFGISTIDQNRSIEHLVIPGIENATVHTITPYQDSLLLVGTGGAGVTIFDPQSGQRKHLTTHLGLASDFIYFVTPDDEGYIWLGSEKGITRIKLNQNFEIVENRHFDGDNGLTGVETNQNAYYIDRETKFFGLLDGLYQFNNLDKSSNKSFALHLTGIELFYGQYSAHAYSDSVAGFFKIPVHPKLPPDYNHITFHFNRVHKSHPKAVKFKYYLENFDKRWSNPSATNHVTYSNLPPGEYVFRVTSTDNSGSWSGHELGYKFTVEKPFYQTAGFIVGLVILLIGLVTLAFYIRVKQRIKKVMMMERIRVREQENLRKEIARDFHDEMGNQLTRIINYVSLLKLNGAANGGAALDKEAVHVDLYAKVENSAKYLYAGTRDFIWSIDPVNDELCKLFIHIRDFGEKLFEEKNIKFRAFNEIKDQTKLPYGFSREANLIFKEVMTNAFKYSQASNVSLTLKRSDGGFEMSFEDDGVGFYTGDVQKSNGLKNIRERADKIHGVLRIQSVRQMGTRIILNFKLNKTTNYGLAV